MHDILAMTYPELVEFFKEIGEAKYRADQFAKWIYEKKSKDFTEISNFKKELQDKLAEQAYVYRLKLRNAQSAKDGTRKFLYALEDGQLIETVLLKHRREGDSFRHTLCLSTQVGCPMACSFCATGQSGFERNLTVSEIVAQVRDTERIEKIKIHNLVFMGMGEPFLNYENVVKAVKIFNEEKFLNIGIRRITISTCGLVPEIYRLSDEEMDLVLAISLHSADDEKRSSIMPVNKKYQLAELREAISSYVDKTSRRVTLEYAMIKGFNDGPVDLRKLVAFCQGLMVHVNLIPINETEGGYQKSDKTDSFAQGLRRNGIEASVRQERGSDIDAACGQLRAKGRK